PRRAARSESSRATFAGSAALFLPEAERANRRLVVEREQARGLAGAAVVVLDPVPGRRHERVARLPRQLGLADSAGAAALDHVEDAARRGAAGTCPLARAQPVCVGAIVVSGGAPVGVTYARVTRRSFGV